MYIQKANIENGRLKYNILGKVNADELETGLADAHYVHEQTTPSNIWIIQHNLGKMVSVITVDSSGKIVFGLVEYISDNEVKIIFKYAFSGKAYCN